MTDKIEAQKSSKYTIAMPTIASLLRSIQDRDARLGLVMTLFIALLATFIWFGNAYGSAFGNIEGLFRAFVLFLLLSVGFVLFFKAIDGSIIPKIIVWYFTFMVLATLSVFWVQAILRTPSPFLVEARCFVDIWSQGCPLGAPMAKFVELAPLEKGLSPENKSSEVGYRPDSRNKVFVQFSGELSRENVAQVSVALKEHSWNVQGASRGGERTAQAVGIDQVRYFHKEDEALAKNLAIEYNALAKWEGFDRLSVAYLDGYESRVPIGQLEVWTSVD